MGPQAHTLCSSILLQLLLTLTLAARAEEQRQAECDDEVLQSPPAVGVGRSTKQLHKMLPGLLGRLLLLAWLPAALAAGGRRTGRLLNPIQVVSFPQDACVVQVGGNVDTTGICLSGSECNARGGVIIGSCAQGFGACCTIYVSDCVSSNFQKNLTYIVNPSYPGTYSASGATCTYTLAKATTDICMIRLDFLDGTISDPSTKGSCDTSYFTGNPITGPNIPPICGGNDGLHLYMDAGAYYYDQSTFSVVVGESGLDWKVLVSQIECSSKSLPWEGCLQYYMGDEGQVYSFNYWSPYEHLQDQHYEVCVRHNLGMCSIGWIQSPEEVDSFKISQPSTKYIGVAGTLCYADFIQIPRGSNGGRGLCDCGTPSANTNYGNEYTSSCDTFCGGSLNCNNKAVYDARSEIISKQLPFGIGVNLNGAEPAPSNNRGFNLLYRQYPCTV